MLDDVAILDGARYRDEVVKRVSDGDRRLAITGRRAVGKSAVLAASAQALGQRGWRVIRTAMPPGNDAGPLAMSLVASQLDKACRDSISDPGRRWENKVEELVAGIRRAVPPRSAGQRGPAPGLLVTIDDPRFARSDQISTIFDERAVELVGRLSSLDQVAVVVASSRAVPGDWGPKILVEAGADRAAVLHGFSATSLSTAASTVAALGQRLAHRSPLELRLLVAIEARRRGAALKALDSRAHVDLLIAQVLDCLGPAAVQGCLRATVMRTPFDDAALTAFWKGAADDDVALVRNTLLLRSASGWVIPDAVSFSLRARDVEPTRLEKAHEIAAKFHARAFGLATEREPEDVLLSGIRHELEELHHLANAGNLDELVTRKVYFVDYFDAVGRQLGQRGVRLYEKQTGIASLRMATRAYERALNVDARDAYAHHYLAYNLDLLAENAAEVEQHYRMALEIDDDHVWHHGRLISFLITHGRIREAEMAWTEALARFPEPRPSWVYEELHWPVGRLLLHRGELDLATAVLDSIGPDLSRFPWARAENRLLRRLREAESDRLVFPSGIDEERRWSGPHLIEASLRPKVRTWWAGRIESWRGGECTIRLGNPDNQYGRRHLSEEELRSALGTPEGQVAAGRFLELIRWRSGHESIYLHPEEVDDADLPQVFPPADRYLKRATRVTQAQR